MVNIVGRIFIERDKIDPVLYPPAPHVIFAASPDHMPITTHISVNVKRFRQSFLHFGATFLHKCGLLCNDDTCSICSYIS